MGKAKKITHVIRVFVCMLVALMLGVVYMFTDNKTVESSADTTSFYDLRDGNNYTGITVAEENNVVSVDGSYSYSKVLLIGKTGFDLTQTAKTSIQLTPDVADTGTDNAKEELVCFTLYYGTLDTSNVTYDSFAYNRTSGNGFRFRFFVNQDLLTQNRALYEVKTFSQQGGTGEVLRQDSTYGSWGTDQAVKDGAIDLAYMFTTGGQFDVTVSTSGENTYITFEMNRAGRNGTTSLQVAVPHSAMITDASSTQQYYFGYEFFSWNDWTARTLDAQITAPTEVDSGTPEPNPNPDPNPDPNPSTPTDPVPDDSTTFVKINDSTATSPVQNVGVSTNATSGVTTIQGNQAENRTLVIYDSGITLDQTLKTSFTYTGDFTGTGTDNSLLDYVNFGFYFGTATKGDGFTKDTFSPSRTTGNGFRFRFFSNESLSSSDPQRATFNLKTFSGQEICSLDSLYNDGYTATEKEAWQDIAWAYTTGEKAIGIEIKFVETNLYLKLSVDRTDNPYRTGISEITVTIPGDKFIQDASSTEQYYFAFDFLNTVSPATNRNVNCIIDPVRLGQVANVSFTETTLTLIEGAIHQLTPVYDVDGYIPETFIWYSSNKEVATVDQTGVVKGHSIGTAIITYNVDGKLASCSVEIIGDLVVVELAKTIRVGTTYQINASINPITITITYEVADESIVSVNENGLVTALKEGETTVTVKAENYSERTVTITVAPASEIDDNGDKVETTGGCGGVVSLPYVSFAVLTLVGAWVVQKRKRD